MEPLMLLGLRRVNLKLPTLKVISSLYLGLIVATKHCSRSYHCLCSSVGYEDLGAVWRANYEVDNFEEQAENLYNQLRPLYENLHAYTRRKLYETYGGTYMNLRGPIPAHLLGKLCCK